MLFSFFISYLIGSISPSSYFSKKVFSSDLASLGSGNPGATNMGRNFGFHWGIIILLLDGVKGFLMAYFFDLPGAFGVLVGHCYSLYLFGRGGKGVSTTLGVIFFLSPDIALIALVFAAIFYAFRFEPFISHIAALLIAWIPGSLQYKENPEAGYFLIFSTIIILIRHRNNLDNLRTRIILRASN